MQTELDPLSRRYDVVVANPPYMGSKNMNKWLGDWIKKHYKNVKGDLFSCFMVRNVDMGTEHAQLGFMTPYVWMFIGTYEKLRKFVIQQNTITSLIQLEYSGFSGATVPICTFTLQKGYCPGYRGGYVRLSDFVGADQQAPRALEALANPHCGWFYRVDASDFEAIPGSPIAYWANEKILAHFKFDKSLSSYTEPRQGFATGDNGRFLRNWWEPSFSKSNLCGTLDRGRKWHPCNKGGSFRKWYGNNELVVNWANDGDEMKSSMGSVIRNPQYYFRKGMTWGTISSGKLSMRFSPEGFLFESKGSVCFPLNEEDLYLHLALANACTTIPFLEILCPTLDFHEGPIGEIPTVLPSADNRNATMRLVKECILLSKADWDAFESSCDFKQHPLFR